MLVVNFIGGPGVGKSTLATTVFSNLKKRGINSEYCHEWIKWKFWEDHPAIVEDQLFVFANQFRQQYLLRDKVDVCVTDSPLFMSLHYGKEFRNGFTANSKSFYPLVTECWEYFNNITFYVKRDHPYPAGERGRSQQSEKHADEIADSIYDFLRKCEIPFYEIPSTIDPLEVVKTIEERLEDERLG